MLSEPLQRMASSDRRAARELYVRELYPMRWLKSYRTKTMNKWTMIWYRYRGLMTWWIVLSLADDVWRFFKASMRDQQPLVGGFFLWTSLDIPMEGVSIAVCIIIASSMIKTPIIQSSKITISLSLLAGLFLVCKSISRHNRSAHYISITSSPARNRRRATDRVDSILSSRRESFRFRVVIEDYGALSM